MKVLRESKLILSYSGLDNADSVQVAGHCIPRIFVRVAIFAALALCLILTTMLCVQNRADGISAILFPIGIILTYGSLICQYTTFVWVVDKIGRLFDYLQYAIDQSKKIGSNSVDALSGWTKLRNTWQVRVRFEYYS